MYQNKISAADPQLMLMPNGRAFLYDFGLYEFKSSMPEVNETYIQFNNLAKIIEQQI